VKAKDESVRTDAIRSEKALNPRPEKVDPS